MILPYLAITLLLLVTLYSASASFRRPTAGIQHTWLFPSGTNRAARKAVGVGTLLLVALLIGLAMWSHTGQERAESRPSRFLIPEGYVGWVRIEFDVLGTPTVPIEDGGYLFKVPPTGVLKTSLKLQDGWPEDRYYYYSEERRRELSTRSQDGKRLIWSKINGAVSGLSGEKSYEEFFVGTEQQFRQQMNASTATPDVPK
jgi:hypothetical protein